MRQRFSVTVYARRGSQPCYSYVVQDRVRPGRVQDVVDDTALDILNHETRSGMSGYLTTRHLGASVVVEGNRFVVRARRV